MRERPPKRACTTLDTESTTMNCRLRWKSSSCRWTNNLDLMDEVCGHREHLGSQLPMQGVEQVQQNHEVKHAVTHNARQERVLVHLDGGLRRASVQRSHLCSVG